MVNNAKHYYAQLFSGTLQDKIKKFECVLASSASSLKTSKTLLLNVEGGTNYKIFKVDE